MMFESERAAFSKLREEFCKERVEFEEEQKEARDQVPLQPRSEPSSRLNEVVALNVGGEAKVTVSLDTLLQCPECRFTSIFSQHQHMPKDSQGRIFIDFKPTLFLPLLEHLRMRRIEESHDPTPPPQFQDGELEAQFR